MSPWQQEYTHTILSTHVADGPDVPPGQTGVFSLTLPENWKHSDALAVTAIDPTGREIWTWTWPIESRQTLAQTLTRASTPGTLKVTSQDNRLVITTQSNKVVLDERTGM